jgi:SMC domain protein
MDINGYKRIKKKDSEERKLASTLASHQLVYTPLNDVNSLARGGELHGRDGGNPIQLILTGETSDDSVRIEVKRGKNKNLSINVEGEKFFRVLKDPAKPYSVMSPGLAGIPASEEYKSKGVVTRAAARGDANSVFRNVLLQLKEKEKDWEWFQGALRKIFSNITVDVSFDTENGENISATVVLDGVRLPIDSSGTGVLQAIQILAYIGLYEPRILILDEPDSHLHPNNQRKLVNLLDEVTRDRGFQVLISTHSRPFIDALSSVESKFVWVADGVVKSDNFDMIQAFMDLGALDIADYLNGGATRHLILTEDENLSYIESIATASGITESIREIRPYNGVTKIRSAMELAKFIGEKSCGTRVYIHRDRDWLRGDDVEKECKRIAAAGAIPFITRGTDLESHFLVPEHVASIYPGVSQSDAKDLVAEAISLAKDDSIDKFYNTVSRDALEEHFKNRTENKFPDLSKIRRECEELYESDPIRFTYGKRALAALKNLIQERSVGDPKKITSPSRHIAVNVFKHEVY